PARGASRSSRPRSAVLRRTGVQVGCRCGDTGDGEERTDHSCFLGRSESGQRVLGTARIQWRKAPSSKWWVLSDDQWVTVISSRLVLRRRIIPMEITPG